ncbi:glutamyl-tRNA(Gln) amidotransferase subunit A [Marmoricola endophyticus]|uniref:Glutamyl-tRNA(Gln) amidotransferase subunit A n=1 Tax=Marmoricola endophyticus TaxID=2040280 RepID=A0A917BCA4_9ACTN|nr:amidase [Marmoricola endophyticus]GGF37207.1 glutamyl-tRNA(Gln) amidotransferase subunit A [Marmoricola endophyticus]
MSSDPTLDPTRLDARALADAVRRGAVSAVDVARAHLARVAADRHHAILAVDPDRVIAQATAVDARPDRDRLPLAGVPVTVKDNVDVAGEVTTAGSLAHDGMPAEADAPVVTRLRAAGAVLLGRANMDEVAMGASTQTSAYGPTRNPADPRRSPGGSSGGCAAAVAAGLVPLAVGTDTGGSIREPASQCGVVGMAPSPGLVPADGVLPFHPELDRVGPLARTAADAALLLDVLAGGLADPSPVRRIGVVAELSGPRNRPDVLDAFDRWSRDLETSGIEVVTVSVADGPEALAAYMTLTSVAALDWLGPWLASGRAGEEVVRRAEYAASLVEEGAERVEWAEQVRTRLHDQVAAALREVDVLVSPTMPTVAPPLVGEITPEELADPLAAPYTDCWTVVANLAGVPALSVPAPAVGLPVGAMLMGRPGADADLLALAPTR